MIHEIDLTEEENATLDTLLKAARAALSGDSNDAEHEALYALTEFWSSKEEMDKIERAQEAL